jgi:integrase
VEDVDFEESTIFIRYAKRDKQRMVPLHDRAREALEAYLSDRSTGPIFLSGQETRISNRRLRSLAREQGSRKICTRTHCAIHMQHCCVRLGSS